MCVSRDDTLTARGHPVVMAGKAHELAASGEPLIPFRTKEIRTVNRGAGVIGSQWDETTLDVPNVRKEPDSGYRFTSASTDAGGRDGQLVRDLLLVALTVASGAVDAISYLRVGEDIFGLHDR
jgi:hypothetical protein